jgi:tryptophanyl-tRNA synthetase
MLIPGTNGGKMSKSANNIINIFLDDKSLRKQVMSIETDSTPLEDPKIQTCNAFAIINYWQPKTNYHNDYHYWAETMVTVKTSLVRANCETFKTEREKYNYLNNLEEVDALLKIGAEKLGCCQWCIVKSNERN